MGEAGVPTLCYNFRGIGNFRTTRTIGRGGASYSTFDYEEFMTEPPDYPDHHISEEKLRENLQHFLEHIVPTAEEAEVQLTMHPTTPRARSHLAVQPESSQHSTISSTCSRQFRAM